MTHGGAFVPQSGRRRADLAINVARSRMTARPGHCAPVLMYFTTAVMTASITGTESVLVDA
jgi:hypothetical protein